LFNKKRETYPWDMLADAVRLATQNVTQKNRRPALSEKKEKTAGIGEEGDQLRLF